MMVSPEKKYFPDWKCGKCDFTNFAKRATCRQCSRKKEEVEVLFKISQFQEENLGSVGYAPLVARFVQYALKNFGAKV